ncbi:MAG: hypothetical protein JKY82_03025 [Rhizobiaceae bacterium]|nr:hypothetical protein [Rhizobiaceae bacterium]
MGTKRTAEFRQEAVRVTAKFYCAFCFAFLTVNVFSKFAIDASAYY